MEVIGIGVAITGIMVEDEGIIGNGKVIMLYYTLHICEYIHLVIIMYTPFTKYIRM